MSTALPHPQQQRWERYLAAESREPRVVMLRALDDFVDGLVQLPEATWKRWALDLAARVVDDGADVPVRHPLFRRVLFPALAEALDVQSPGSARWLAGLSQNLYRCPACMERLGPGRSTERALLLAALAQDPADDRSRRQLIRVIAEGFYFALHELPAGVLYGMDGATAEQCDELSAELEEFRSLIAVEGWVSEYATLVADCDHHFKAYKQYLLARPRYRDYAHFLEAYGGGKVGR